MDDDLLEDGGALMLRMPPHSTESERSVLGSLLLDNAAWEKAADLLVEDDFYVYENRHVFAAIKALVEASRPADVITVYEQLRSNGELHEEIGGLAYLNSLAQYVPGASNIRRYAEIVREKSVLRQLVTQCDAIAATALAPVQRPVSELLDEAERKVMAIGESTERGRQSARSIGDVMVSLIDRVQELADRGGDVTGIATGYVDIDKMTAGMQPGDLVVLAARPSMGKTALAINIAEHVALNLNLPVIVFSMEMSADQLGVRMVGSIGRINQMRLRTGRLNDEEWPRLAEAVEKLRTVRVSIEETGGLTVTELRAKARRLARRLTTGSEKLGLIVVDYLQLMEQGSGGDENRATALGEISRGLKTLAKELDCPVLALSQLNRGVEARTDKRPVMSDIRESGAIEQDADTIMFIYRDEYYNKDSQEPGIAEVNIAKQRNGPTGMVKLAFIKTITKFENLAYG